MLDHSPVRAAPTIGRNPEPLILLPEHALSVSATTMGKHLARALPSMVATQLHLAGGPTELSACEGLSELSEQPHDRLFDDEHHDDHDNQPDQPVERALEPHTVAERKSQRLQDHKF